MAPPQPIATRLLALARMGADLCRAESEPALLGAIARHVRELFNVDVAVVGLRSSDGTTLRVIPLSDETDNPMLGSNHAADDLALKHATVGSNLIEESGLSDSHFRDLAELGASGMSTALVAPLKLRQRAIGAVILARAAPEQFNDEDRLLALQAGSLIAAGIKNLRASAELQRAEVERHRAEMFLGRRAGELDSLNRLFAMLDNVDLRMAVNRVVSEFVALRGIELCRIAAFDDEGVLTVVASDAEHNARFQDGGPIVRSTSPDHIAVTRRSPSVWRRTEEDDPEGLDLLRGLGATSVFALPIMWDGEPIGSILAGSTGGHRLVTDEHMVMAEIICRRISTLANQGPAIGGLWNALRERRPEPVPRP